MQVLIECAIFDDGDVMPTVLIMDWVEPNGGYHSWRLRLLELLVGLRLFAEEEYGRSAPDHAVFWRCHPKPEPSEPYTPDIEHGGEA